MISPELRIKIRRLFYVDHLTINAISETAGVHHDTVRHALESASFARRTYVRARKVLEPYMGLVHEKVEEVPRIRATRLCEILGERGYPGSVYVVRAALREIRGRGDRRVYSRLTMFPGEQAQCDWGSCGEMTIGRGKRKLSIFVMVLSHSRRMYAEFTLDMSFESFLRGHIRAFRAFDGVPRSVLYDNLKSAVIERFDQTVRFNRGLLEVAGHYQFRPEACTPRRGNEKGRVERSIGYLRTSFLPARRFHDLADANRQLHDWIAQQANRRPWPADRNKTVEAVFLAETESLLKLPEHDLPSLHIRPARADKTGYVRFDRNDYSVPPEASRMAVTILASDVDVRIQYQHREVAKHVRNYGTGELIADPVHLEDARRTRQASLPPRRKETLLILIPESAELMSMLVAREENLHPHLRRIYDLIELHGKDVVAKAIRQAVERGTPRADSVAHWVTVAEADRNKTPSIPIELPNRNEVRDLVVRTHDLTTYDKITEEKDHE